MTDKFIGRRVIARGVNSGVYYGTLTERNGQECVLADARSLRGWEDESLSVVADEGEVRTLAPVELWNEIILMDVYFLLPCSADAAKRLDERL